MASETAIVSLMVKSKMALMKSWRLQDKGNAARLGRKVSPYKKQVPLSQYDSGHQISPDLSCLAVSLISESLADEPANT